MKRILISLLITSFLLVSCGSQAETADTTAKPDTTEATETTRDSIPEGLDFGGKTVVIYAPNDLSIVEFDAEQTGDIVDDAVYKRNMDVQERLNITFEWNTVTGLWAGEQTYKGTLRTNIMSGDAAFDLVAGYGVFVAQLAAEQLFCDLTSTAYLDFSQPWWSDSLIDNLSINGKLYFASGDISTNTIGTSFAVLFNKKLLESYKLENPYQLVDSGKWTLDKLFSMTGDIYDDLNGSGSRDAGDFYGLYSQQTSFDNLYFAAGMTCVNPDKSGGMSVSADFGSEKMSSLIEKLCTAFNHTDGCQWGTEDSGEVVKSFIDQHTVFMMSGLKAASVNLRTTDFEYGVLPAPKWDEAQENYISTTAYTGALWTIPIDAADIDTSSAVMEALAVESYYNVAPAFFEIALKVKYSSDDDSVRMYDIIRESRTYDFGRVFSMAGLQGIPGKLRSMVTDDNINWMSYYESQITVLETVLAELVENLS